MVIFLPECAAVVSVELDCAGEALARLEADAVAGPEIVALTFSMLRQGRARVPGFESSPDGLT